MAGLSTRLGFLEVGEGATENDKNGWSRSRNGVEAEIETTNTRIGLRLRMRLREGKIGSTI